MIAQAGLQAGFGEFIGADSLIAIRERGFTIVRIDLQEQDDDRTAQMSQEVVDHGLQPLAIIRRPEQLYVMPTGTLVDFGNEPDLDKFLNQHWGGRFANYLAGAERAVQIALNETGHRLYVGVVSNLNKRGFAFLERLPWGRWPETICCSIHRYPDGRSPKNPHKGFKSREHEVAHLRAIVGPRPLACTETGYYDSKDGWTEAQVAENMAWERRFFSEQGFEVCVAFQLNDGPDHDQHPEGNFGFRRHINEQRPTTEWKPVAQAFVEAVS